MPRPAQLPTPMASTEIPAQDGSKAMSMALELELPPSAFESRRSPSLSEGPEYTPPSPKSKPARRSSTKRVREVKKVKAGNGQITLPPPPGRARKIIEMKPSKSITNTFASKTQSEPPSKKPSSVSRKISRKTAHSLIERRRRGKMNEVFEVLKEMVPACESSGREMHKLEILKASVEYIRYLKECVWKLQGDGEGGCCALQLPLTLSNGRDEAAEGNATDDEDTDVEMEISSPEPGTPRAIPEVGASPKIDPQLVNLPYNPPPTPKLSPAILPQPDRHFILSSVTSPLRIPHSSSMEQRHHSFSSQHSRTSPHHQLHAFSFAEASTLTQAFAQTGHGSTTPSTLTSPLLAAQTGEDQDATVALLMLNGEWPSRGYMGSRDSPRIRSLGAVGKADEQARFGRRRGLSVRDLLSS